MSSPSNHRRLSHLVARCLLILGFAGGALLATAGPAAADQYCVDVYPQQSWGTTVCTPG